MRLSVALYDLLVILALLRRVRRQYARIVQWPPVPFAPARSATSSGIGGSIHLSTLSHGYELVSNRMLTFTPRKKLCNETPDKAAAPTLLRVG